MEDTYAQIKPNKMTHASNILNSDHPKIQFIYELEENNKISFLNALVKRTLNNKFKRSIFRKSTKTDIQMNWNTHAPAYWKVEILKTFIKRGGAVCSNENLLKTEIEHLRKVFVKMSSKPRHIVNRVINQELSQNLETIQENDQTEEPTETAQLIVPYTGKQGHKIISKVKKDLSKALSSKVKTMVTCQETKLLKEFNIKN